MPKRTDISKILIIGSGSVIAILAWCLAVAGLAVGECVLATPEVKYEPSSAHVRIATVRNGRPMKNVKIDFPGILPGSFSTDDAGVATLPTLHLGKQCIGATAPDHAVALLCLDVSSDAKDKSSLFSIELPPPPVFPTERDLAKAGDMSVGDRVREFKGTVQDLSGAAVPGAEIVVLRKGAQDKKYPVQVETDTNGHFSAHLTDGVYMAFFRMPGFRTQIAVFEVGERQHPKDLQIALQIASCCGSICQ